MSQFAKIFESMKETPAAEKKTVVKLPKTKTHVKAEGKSKKQSKQSVQGKIESAAAAAPKQTPTAQEKAVLLSETKTTAAPLERIPEETRVLPTTASPIRKGGKSSNQDYTQVLTYIRRDTHKLIKKALIDDPLSRDLSDLVEELLAEWIKKTD